MTQATPSSELGWKRHSKPLVPYETSEKLGRFSLLAITLGAFAFLYVPIIVLVVFSFNLAVPISQLASTVTRSTLGIAMACVMLSFLMMITRRKAIPQVIGFLSMENGLFFAATSATYGMPMVVELGIALDVLVGVLILGVFFFQIREQFDSLDLKHLETLKEENE